MADGSGRPARSMGEIVRRRQQVGFVGREAPLAFFRDNLALPADDERRRFVFTVHGDGGVGKTSLLARLRQAATEAGRLTALVDDGAYDVPETLAALVRQLREQGVRFKRFDQRYADYRRRLSSPDEARAGRASTATKAAVRIGLGVVRELPGGSIATSTVSADDVAEGMDDLRLAAVHRMRDSDDRAPFPVEELTDAFVEGLNQARRGVAVFFDTYERTAFFLDAWLRTVFERLPPEIVITVAGRHALDASAWSAYLPVIADVPLAPFTDVETRQALIQAGISDEATIADIIRTSGGLPLAVAMLAANGPATSGNVTTSLVERFLQAENDPALREIALLAALPRRLDRDILAAIIDADKVDRAYDWLSSQAFVSRTDGRFHYHAVVRAPIVRLARTRSAGQWQRLHSRLARKYQALGRQMGDDPSRVEWRGLLLEQIYHVLCALTAVALPEALAGAVMACSESVAEAARWADMITDAGNSVDDSTLTALGERLAEALRAERDAEIGYLDILLQDHRLPADQRSIAHRERGRRNRIAGRYDQALADHDRALTIEPDYAAALADRGETYRRMRRYPEALADLDRAIELDPDYIWALGSRGETYHALGRYEEAVADFDRAIALAPNYKWAIGNRAEVYREMGARESALADLTRAIELDADYTWALSRRGLTYVSMDRYDEALADLDRAVEIEPDHAWALAARGSVCHRLGRDEEAVADITAAIELGLEQALVYEARAAAYRALGDDERAAADFARAQELKNATS